MLSYSQDTPKNTSTPLTKRDSILLDLRDTVKVPYLYVKTANKAFIEVKSWRKVAGLNQAELHSKDIEIAYYKRASEKYEKAYDTLTKVTLPAYKIKSDDNQKLYEQFKKAYQMQRIKTISTSVTIPVALAVGFLLGWYIHVK